jgi:hypothetical protein
MTLIPAYGSLQEQYQAEMLLLTAIATTLNWHWFQKFAFKASKDLWLCKPVDAASKKFGFKTGLFHKVLAFLLLPLS